MALTRRLQKTNRDQYTLTIPKQLIELLNWNEKNTIEIGFEDGKITLQKTNSSGKEKSKKVSKNEK